MNDTDELVGREVKVQLVRHGWSQQDFAEFLGISYGATSRRLTGKQSFKPYELARIAELFKVPVDTLFGR